MIRLLAALAVLLALGASAQPLALPAPPHASLEQQPGALLPLDAQLRDDLGQAVRLGDYFHPDQPVLLVPSYYRCTQLCGLLMQGLLQSLQASGLPRSDWRIVAFSIDPGDAPADAHRRRDLDLAYASFLDGAHDADTPLHLDVLVCSPARERRGASPTPSASATKRCRPPRLRPRRRDIAHPAAVIVVTPDGRIARYFPGVRFAPDAIAQRPGRGRRRARRRASSNAWPCSAATSTP